MQFIPRGPDIPNNLLFAHEEGRVVFFCGAGISMGKPANLPSFKDLVKRLFEDCSNTPAWKSRKNAPLDRSLTWLEDTVPGKRKEIIERVYEILNPADLPAENSPIHEALLALARPRNSDATMLVTTNFDRLFERCLQDDTNKQPEIIAPRLPIPKSNYWYKGGVVYLHGLIPENSSNNAHKDNLILTSGDFGRAYLSERWAARFVTELFRNYVVCFVGYSLNDPVMRYLSDALADDGKDGMRLPERYIFLPKREGKNIDKKDYPGLDIISYPKTRNHHLLRDTLKKWAKDYSDRNTRNRIIRDFIDSGTSTLSHTTKVSAVPGIDRFMWALHNKDAAKYFAMMPERPAWEIINVLDAKEFGFDDLISFGHSNIPIEEPDNFHSFSLLEPKIKFEDMTYWNISDSDFKAYNTLDASPVPYFYRWIARYVDNPKTALWVAQRGGSLNVQMKDEILRELARSRKADEHSDPLVYPIMREIWGLILSDDIYPSYDMMSWRDKFYAWLEQYKITGLTPSLERQLKLIIQPKVKLPPNIHVSDYTVEERFPEADELKDAQYIEDIFLVDIDLVPDHGVDELKKIALDEETPDDEKLFYIHFFHSLLCKIFALADDICGDRGHFTVISDNYFNNILDREKDYFSDEWYHLIDAMPKLLKQIMQKDQEKAKAIAMEWLDSRHIFINRLGLHCLRESPLIDSEAIIKILFDDDAKFLTNIYARRQVTPLLESYATQFSEDVHLRIQTILLALEHKDFDYVVFLHLKALQDAEIPLLEEANARIEELKEKLNYFEPAPTPKPTPPPSVEDTESIWVKYLENPPKDPLDPFQQNLSLTWNNLCEVRPLKAFEILKLLSTEESKVGQSWHWHSFFGKIASIARQQVEALSDKDSDGNPENLPNKKLNESDLIAIIDYWLNGMEESNQLEFLSSMLDVVESSLRLLISSDEGNALLNGCMKHIMALLTQYPKHDFDDDLNKQDILTAAINNPIGKFAELVMQYQILTSPQYSEGLLSITKQFFEEILSIKQSDISRYGLCVIARRLIYLFSYDKEWTIEKLIPWFSWNDATKARAAWSGYLWHAHWTPDLIKSLDNDLLATINHIDDVDEDCKDTFAHLIGSLALYETGILSVAKLRECVEKFDENLLCALLEKVRSSLEAVEKGDRGAFWQNRIEPFFQKIWQNDTNKLESSMSHTFEHIILMEGNAFPHAVERLAYQWAAANRKSTETRNFIGRYFRFVLEHLKDKEHAKNYPEDTLNLLYEILDGDIILNEEQRGIWEQHILVHLEPLNDKRLESIKKKLK